MVNGKGFSNPLTKNDNGRSPFCHLKSTMLCNVSSFHLPQVKLSSYQELLMLVPYPLLVI